MKPRNGRWSPYVNTNVKIGFITGAVCFAGMAINQTSASTQSADNARPRSAAGGSAKHDVGSGAGDIGKGAAKGVGSAAKGTGKAAADLIALHPINAATDF